MIARPKSFNHLPKEEPPTKVKEANTITVVIVEPKTAVATSELPIWAAS